MTPDEWNAFTAAVTEMHNRGWMAGLARIHNTYASDIHGNGIFFPWHRRFLIHIQSLLYIINPKVVLPYWDWTIDWDAPENGRVLSNSYFGGNGDLADQCLRSGFQSGWMRTVPSDSCITRKYVNGNTPGPFWPMEALVRLISTTNDYYEYSKGIENGSHGVVHVGVGADFMEMWAPNDMLFFMHHGMVDKLWLLWENQNSARFSQMSGSGPQGTTMSLDSNMPYYNEPVSVVMRPTDPGNCFTYDDLATDQNRISTFASTGRFNSTISSNVAGSEKMASKKLVVPRLVVHDMGSLFKYDMVYVNKMNDFVRDTVHMMQEQL